MIPAKKPPFPIASVTHPGMTGKNNEDRAGFAAYRLTEGDPTPILFALVADGVGGKQAGEVAAQIAVDMLMEAVEKSDGSDPTAVMRQALMDSSAEILARSAENAETAGMGTTATCAWIVGDRLYAANIGNSRLYLLRDGRLRRLSIDHSWVQEAMDHGFLTPQQARKHPNARIITRHLGMESIEPDLRIRLSPDENDDQMLANQGLALQPGDRLLICSDGLSDPVEEEEIQTALRDQPLEAALEQLTALANARGGPDNITSVAIEIPAKPRPAPGGKAPRKAVKRSTGVQVAVYVFSVLVFVLLVLIGWGLLQAYLP